MVLHAIDQYRLHAAIVLLHVAWMIKITSLHHIWHSKLRLTLNSEDKLNFRHVHVNDIVLCLNM